MLIKINFIILFKSQENFQKKIKPTKITPKLKTDEMDFHEKKMEAKSENKSSDTAQSSPSFKNENRPKLLEIEGLIQQKSEIEKWRKNFF